MIFCFFVSSFCLLLFDFFLFVFFLSLFLWCFYLSVVVFCLVMLGLLFCSVVFGLMFWFGLFCMTWVFFVSGLFICRVFFCHFVSCLCLVLVFFSLYLIFGCLCCFWLSVVGFCLCFVFMVLCLIDFCFFLSCFCLFMFVICVCSCYFFSMVPWVIYLPLCVLFLFLCDCFCFFVFSYCIFLFNCSLFVFDFFPLCVVFSLLWILSFGCHLIASGHSTRSFLILTQLSSDSAEGGRRVAAGADSDWLALWPLPCRWTDRVSVHRACSRRPVVLGFLLLGSAPSRRASLSSDVSLQLYKRVIQSALMGVHIRPEPGFGSLQSSHITITVQFSS